MNLLVLLARVPLFVWVALLVGFVLPGLSALLTRAPSFLTGVLTAVSSILTGVVADAIHAATSGDSFNWGKAFASAVGVWAVAVVAHSKVWAGTPQVKALHAAGTKRKV